jgi:DNA-binding transcriptional ArsR family regulator
MYSYIHDVKTMSNKDKTTNIGVDEASRLAELFRALGDPSRIRILAAITEQALNVGAIAEIAGISESAVSHHMRGLRQMRLVRANKNGREVYYTLDDDHVADLFRYGLEHIRHG